MHNRCTKKMPFSMNSVLNIIDIFGSVSVQAIQVAASIRNPANPFILLRKVLCGRAASRHLIYIHKVCKCNY